MKEKLYGVPETLLIPLWARAAETRERQPIIRDEKAAEILSGIDYDFSRFNRSNLTQVGVSIRTMILDRALSAFLKQHQGSIVINLGAGLDTRCRRLQWDQADWYDLDLPETIALRRRFFTETQRHRFITGSMFDLSWMDRISVSDRPVIIIAEGLFMYFTEAELKPFFQVLADRYPGGELLFEMIDPLIVGRSKHHETVRKIDSKVEFKWGVKDSRILKTWHSGIEIVEEWNYFDYFKKRWKWFGYLARLPFIRLSNRIVHLRFSGPDTRGGRS